MTAPTIAGAYVIGHTATERDAFTVPAPGHGLPHLLISGETGSGKSSTVAKILKGLSADPRVALVGVDFKGGLELHPWEPRFTYVADNHPRALQLLTETVKLIDHRVVIMKATAKAEGRIVRDWEDPMGARLVVVVDEMSIVDKAELELLKNIAARGRALGITLICCTQYALAKDFDTDFLNNLGGRVCHRMQGPTQYSTALRFPEKHLEDAGWQPIPIGQPGVGYVTGIPGIADMTRVRSKYVSDDVIGDWVPQVAHLRWEPTRVFPN